VLIQVQQIALSMAGKEAAGQHSGKLFGWLMALIVAIGAAATALHQLAVH
jgi:hypothetical protein